MIRQLSQCPYCGRCEIALDDEPRQVFNPDGPDNVACEHLVWVGGRYSQWEPTPHGTNRVIGSTEFRWDHRGLREAEDDVTFTDYLRERGSSGRNWEFAPAETFEMLPITADEKAAGPKGRSYTTWDVDGWALFALHADALVARLPGCRDRHLASLEPGPDEGR
jgi:hypothetical protein